jgi:hypothetical protein
MKRWVPTHTLEQPDCTVSGRFGASVMFVGYCRVLRQWYWLQPNGIIEKIPEPEAIFVDDAYVNKHTLTTPRGKRERAQLIRGKHNAQLLLDM